MIRRFCLVRSRVAISVASLAALALMSTGCSDQVGGIILPPDGAGGAKDSSTDSRAGAGGNSAGSGGAAGSTPDGAPKDAFDDTPPEGGSDAGVPPLCIFHTEPPPATFSQLDDGGVDAPADASGGDAGTVDVTQDTSVADATLDISVDGSQPPFDAPSNEASDDVGTGPRDVASDRRDGVAGDGAIPTSITVLNNAFVGPYLADSAGRALYTFGNDQAGDCKNLPVPDCEADCAVAWPPFDAGKRTLPANLNPMAFGSVVRPDGMTNITTYYGWPLYYYRTDLSPGQVVGHGKSKTWHLATVLPAGMMIMRAKTNPRYIADANGYTLYVYDQDTAGTATTDPKTTCTGACATEHPPFLSKRINAVSTLDPNDLSLFVRPDMGQQQVAYKGVPLYLSSSDTRSGDQKGVTTGWTVAAPP